MGFFFVWTNNGGMRQSRVNVQTRDMELNEGNETLRSLQPAPAGSMSTHGSPPIGMCASAKTPKPPKTLHVVLLAVVSLMVPLRLREKETHKK